ncbi:hypothetical protein BJF93_23840 [Xaviernesmea oryzae]|uniref:Calcineurin-like phosphoesterase domain-containing protein n=1 Tax=Xaviernesmea oryzae TaxID=464029 RepID=A0A1Q9B2Y6_9HYPH|nr:metallophosphoesterase [Xaviernesmea oryzae]OLP62385.1 hypothetical protein BJF93_23840 [Xaviernesmea oryzae]SEL98971.1 Calcineurin-like phosphoesterase [Xaviernesmea oryzae]
MSPALPFRFAVLSDAHVHDIEADHGLADAPEGLHVRLLADTMRSTRTFNESKAALEHALEDVAARGIRHVVITGDYSDDGQEPARRAARAVFQDASERLGLRIFLTVGNHDVFADEGRHRSKRFLTASGGYGLVTSDPERRDPQARSVTLSPAMRCLGSPQGLTELGAFGFFSAEHAAGWQTPFGTNPAPEARRYEVTSACGGRRAWLMDASYLVEPVPGIRFLMIDANVFVPLAPGERRADMHYTDSTNAGWAELLIHKPFLLPWMTEIAEAALRDGAQLFAFSHYPVVDPLDGTAEDERVLLGETEMVKRVPPDTVAAALIQAGIDLHFSGHLHVNDTAQARVSGRVLTNIAVPALCGFPPAYKIVTVQACAVSVETIRLDALALDPRLMRLYAREAAEDGLDPGALLEARDYGEFLSAHIGRIATRRYLKRDWAPAMAAAIRRLKLADLAWLAETSEPQAIAVVMPGDPDKQALVSPALADLPATELLGDWYRLRMGGDLGVDRIGPDRMSVYHALAQAFAAGDWPEGSAQAEFRRFFRMMSAYAEGLPSADFTIDRETGAISVD